MSTPKTHSSTAPCRSGILGGSTSKGEAAGSGVSTRCRMR